MTDTLWLRRLRPSLPDGLESPLDVAREELAAFPDLHVTLRTDTASGEGFSFRDGVLAGSETGILHGTYALIMGYLTGSPLAEGRHAPHFALRMLDCWDNLDGSIERGYAGRSLFFRDGRVAWDTDRIRQLGRLLASVGISCLCINNVNVVFGAQRLMEDLLPDVARLASCLRPFGVRLMLSADFALPLRHGIDSADPLDSRVKAFWRDKAAEIWQAVPDLAGFLIKADSEHRPGPFTYGRTHAEGANMLAEAVAPYGGVIVWRAFVYNCLQDWRDTRTDRPMAALDTYLPLDGAFRDNVILQVKNGPMDFQVREPLSPCLLRLKETRMAVEFQLTQEYTGHQIDLYAMPGLFREVLADLPDDTVRAIAAVSNLGDDPNYVGHPFAAVNLFAYGCMAWNPALSPDDILLRWACLTYPGLPEACSARLTGLLAHSRETYEKYTATLGLGWMVVPGLHYGPSPDGYEYQSWGTYHRADRDAVGVDRTADGTGYLLQYPEDYRQRYMTPGVTPDNLLLFFHRVRYDAPMRDGRTLIQRIYDDHFEGYEETLAMQKELEALLPFLPDEDARICHERMEKQVLNAREWRDVVNTFFHRLSGVPDAGGRTIY